MSGSAKNASRLKLFKNGCRSEGGKVSIDYSMIDGAGVLVVALPARHTVPARLVVYKKLGSDHSTKSFLISRQKFRFLVLKVS